MTRLKDINDARITFYNLREKCEEVCQQLNEDDAECSYLCVGYAGRYFIQVIDVTCDPVASLGYL